MNSEPAKGIIIKVGAGIMEIKRPDQTSTGSLPDGSGNPGDMKAKQSKNSAGQKI